MSCSISAKNFGSISKTNFYRINKAALLIDNELIFNVDTSYCSYTLLGSPEINDIKINIDTKALSSENPNEVLNFTTPKPEKITQFSFLLFEYKDKKYIIKKEKFQELNIFESEEEWAYANISWAYKINTFYHKF